MTEKRKPGRPRTVAQERRWAPWESPVITAELDKVLAALEVPAIDPEARGVFLRALWRQRYISGDAKGQIIMTCRCILESTGNENAMIGPIVRAVHLVMTPALMDHGLALVEAFDQIPLLSILETMVGLNVFTDGELADWYSRAIRNRLRANLEPAKRQESKPVVRVKPVRKPPRAETRIPEVTRNVELGNRLIALRSTIKSNCGFGRQVRRQFEIDAAQSSELMRVARTFGSKPEVYTRLSWDCLVRLASPSLPAAARLQLESSVIAGARVVAGDVVRASRRAREPLPTGRPQRQPTAPAEKMAA